MKKLFLILSIGILSILKAQDTAPDLLSISGPIEYDGTEYFLSWSKPISKTLVRQQYLPIDERIEDFNQLLDFSFFNKEIEMELAVRQKVEEIQDRSKSDKFAKVNVLESPDGTEYIVDYFISESPENGDPYIEYNIYRFRSSDDGATKNFLILAHTKRMYGDLKSSVRSLARQRDHLLTTMIEYKIPEIRVANTL